MSLETSLELNVIKEQMEEFCSFELGKNLIAETHPVYEKLVIRRDNQRMREALSVDIKYGPMPFGGIRDIRNILKNAEKGIVLTASDLLKELRLIQGIRSIHSYEKQIEDISHEELADLCGSLILHTQTEKLLSSCVNDYGEVMDSASSQLREIRRLKKAAEADITAAAARFVSSNSDSVIDDIVTYRNGRAVILVKASDKNSFGGLVYGDSASGQASYVEPASLVHANNRLQELNAAEEEEIHRILVICSKQVGKDAEEEIGNIETCGILDALFAKAEWGRKHDASVADLNEEKKIEFTKARHPLIDPDKVISNNYRLESPYRILLITGPNTGGKTVSLKIFGLFVLMTYCGMPVTCEHATVPFFDQVFADIGDDQSVVSSLSSFSAHVSKLAECAKKATSDSLALLDEIGSGTDPKEGEALAIAILNSLRERETMTVATTHYSRLKSYGKRHDDILLASVQFNMEKLEPTYQYQEGITGASNALEVAERYGLPSSIIKYARFLKAQAKSQEDQLIDQLEVQLNETKQKNEQLDEKLKEINAYQKQLHDEKLSFEKEKDEWKQKADEEAEQYVEKAKQKADAVLKHMRKMQQNYKYHEVLAERQKLNETVRKSEETENVPEQKGQYKAGDVVELRNGSSPARVTSVRKKDITILLNGRQMHVRADQIRPSLKVIPKVKNETVMSVSSGSALSSMPSVCNLIGMHVDEAMEEMQRYMDEAKIRGLHSFRIIHGDGSGALRKAVHEALAADPSVKEYRLGMPQEGGTGATVVTLKE